MNLTVAIKLIFFSKQGLPPLPEALLDQDYAYRTSAAPVSLLCVPVWSGQAQNKSAATEMFNALIIISYLY